MSDTQAAELLTQLARRITASLDLRETLQVVAQAVVDQLGFGAAVVNLVQPGDMCEVAAVAGPDELASGPARHPRADGQLPPPAGRLRALG